MLDQTNKLDVSKDFPFKSSEHLFVFVEKIKSEIEKFISGSPNESGIEFYLQNAVEDNPALFFIVFSLILDEIMQTKWNYFPSEVLENYMLINGWKGICEHEMEHINLKNKRIPILVQKVRFLLTKDAYGMLNINIASDLDTTKYGALKVTLAPRILSYGDITYTIDLINKLPFPENIIALTIFKQRLNISWKDAIYLTLFINSYASPEYQKLLTKIFESQFN